MACDKGTDLERRILGARIGTSQSEEDIKF